MSLRSPSVTQLCCGAGMIGLLTLQAARAAGASRIIAIDLNEKRLEVANNSAPTKSYGVTSAMLLR